LFVCLFFIIIIFFIFFLFIIALLTEYNLFPPDDVQCSHIAILDKQCDNIIKSFSFSMLLQ